jgi:DNA-directed RNA polymerase specialized sigma24 family protein
MKRRSYDGFSQLLEEWVNGGSLTPSLFSHIVSIVEGIASKGNYSGYEFLDDMKQEAYVNILKCPGYKKKYDICKGSAYNYIYTIVTNCFRSYLSKRSVYLQHMKRMKNTK